MLTPFKKKRRESNEVNTGSTADIAFLLLIFFLVTTQIASDKGLLTLLPPKAEPQDIITHERNVLNILANSNNALLIDDELSVIEEVRSKAKAFINNKGQYEELSVSPQKAIISIKTDRGTEYNTYIQVLGEVKAAYNELRAEHLQLSMKEYKKLKRKDVKDQELLEKAKKAYPMRISDAEPSNLSLN